MSPWPSSEAGRRRSCAPAASPSGVVTQPLAPELASLGPFFSVEIRQPDVFPAPPWQRFSALLERTDGRVHAVRAALADSSRRLTGDIDWRVAASAAHLGLVARLLAPAIGARSLGGPSVS